LSTASNTTTVLNPSVPWPFPIGGPPIQGMSAGPTGRRTPIQGSPGTGAPPIQGLPVTQALIVDPEDVADRATEVTLTVRVHIPLEDLDVEQMFSGVHEIVEVCRAWGEIKQATLEGLPPRLELL
jgi:hypothetical protein